MPRFFVGTTQIENRTVTILGEDAHHISRSLRMAAGEEITVCDTESNEYRCRLSAFLPDRVLAEVLDVHRSAAEPPFFLTLFQALPKGDKLDTVIQKAVECGACRIVPFESERCIARVKPEAELQRTERRCRIAAEAAKQCGRGILPRVLPTVSFPEMLEQASEASLVLFCYEGEGTTPIGQLLSRAQLAPACSVAVVVGSEGGFSPEEAALARARGFQMTGLGRRILRTETAPIFALAALLVLSELT